MWGLMIVSYLCIAISIILLAITGLQGYFQFHLMQANHPTFALFTATAATTKGPTTGPFPASSTPQIMFQVPSGPSYEP